VHARQIAEWLSTYEGSRTLIETGLYARGSSPAIDKAIDHHSAIMNFSVQDRDKRTDLRRTLALLADIAGGSRP